MNTDMGLDSVDQLAIRQWEIRIMETNILLGWKPLNLEWYDGTTNPNEHLYAFLTQANLYTNNNTILCRVFPTSLKGAALT